MAANATVSYKQRKEDFVSNLSGGSITEICYVTAVAPVATLLWTVLQTRRSFFQAYSPLVFAVDFLLNVGAILLSFTLYSGAPVLLSALLLAAAAFVYALPPSRAAPRKKPRIPRRAASSPSSTTTTAGGDPAAAAAEALSLQPFLTTYRGCMLVATALAILAVDFRIFPRRFAKVETWGTSLMDIGVGSFVFSAGVVAARPVLKERAAAAAAAAAAGTGRGKKRATATPVSRRLRQALRHSLPLLGLGLVRLLSVKGLDYAEHVSEYGVHWNFFFTLGLLPPFVALVQSAAGVVPSYAGLALLLGGLYQAALARTPLQAYLLTAPRTGLVSMNREGLFSFFGYLAIFLAGQDTGLFVLPRRPRTALLARLAAGSLGWAALYVLSTHYAYGAGWTVSRRLANLPYVLWVVAFNSAQLLAFALVDAAFFPAGPPSSGSRSSSGGGRDAGDARAEKEAHDAATSRVLRAYNRNGLAVFLVANVLTGLVNMTVPTLDVGQRAALGILVAYALAVTGVAVLLDVYDISLKL